MRKNGFTFIELLIVFAIVGILIILAIGLRASGPSLPKHVSAQVSPVEGNVAIISFGNGVWLMKDTSTWGIRDDVFAQSIAQFRRDHPATEIISINVMHRNDNGADVENILIVTKEQ